MSERFFVSTPIAGDQVTLDGAEAHHLAHVMRAAPGEIVTLFDGSGCEFEARVEQIGKAKVDLAVTERREVDREPAIRLTLAVALPKGDRQQWLVEKAVELGVASIVPLVTERGVAKPVASALVRLRRFVIEASKQCGRNRLLEIEEPVSWREFVTMPEGGNLRLIAHPGGKLLRDVSLPQTDGVSHPKIVAAIGAEGGFSDTEVQAALEAGWTSIDLGPRILRVETACVAIAACLLIDAK